MWLRSLHVFVAVFIGMALACLAFLWRSDDQYIKHLNYDDSKVHLSVCCGGQGGLIFYVRYVR